MEPPVVVSTSCRRTGRRDDGVEEIPALRWAALCGRQVSGVGGTCFGDVTDAKVVLRVGEIHLFRKNDK
jgi:hypothetical protein